MSTNNPISFSLATIEKMATTSSFERGEDIFLYGEVQEIIKKGNRYDSVVHGSHPYKVYLTDNPDDLHFNCTCPYNYAGICKHLVAFALKILQGDYQEILQQTIPALSEKEFKSLYSKIPSKKKLLFLKQLLDRDTDLQQQFISFSEEKTEKLDHIIGEKLERIKTEIHTKLSDLDFDNLRYNYDGNYGYHDYYDEMYDVANDEIKKSFEPYISSALNYVKKGNLLDAVRILLGLYEGAQNLPELDNDDYVFDGEYNSNVQLIVNEYIRDISYEINNVVKSNNTVIQVITLVFERISFYGNQTTNEDEVAYCVKEFEGLFQSLAINTETALFLHEQLQENKLESLASAFIVLNIANISSNEKLWIATAEKYAGFDAEITKQLLEKYDSKKLLPDFNRIATMAFENWANKFDKYLIEHLDKEQQEVLFVKALKNYVSNKHSIKYYRILKTYLSKAETLVYVDKLKEDYNQVFYVQLLEIEKRFEDILTCVNKNIDSYELEKLIEPVLNIYPSECFNIIVSINNKAMEEYNRKRKTYQRMVKTLKLLKKISAKKNETDVFLKKLYNHKPNLPALKDEMRQAKLIAV